MMPERRFSRQQGTFAVQCSVAVRLGHPWRRLDQVVLEWGDVQSRSSICAMKYKSFPNYKHIINITKVCNNFIII